jgi:hypothetical protein
MFLLIFLFGPCIINALFRFLSQQVQQIKFQLSVKEYLPLCLPMSLPSSSIRDLWRVHRQTPEISTTTLTHFPIVRTKQLEESSPLFPTAVGYLSQRGDLLGLGI